MEVAVRLSDSRWEQIEAAAKERGVAQNVVYKWRTRGRISGPWAIRLFVDGVLTLDELKRQGA